MGKLIMVIDDDVDDVDLFREALSETDDTAQYITANNGIEAVEKLSRPNIILPDFIFLDLNMPRMDGRQCLVKLRQMPWLQSIPVIIFTTSKLADEGKEFKILGADLCITKPLLYEDLKNTICYVIAEQWKPAPDSYRDRNHESAVG
jgi:CheY-like chemotaxis protein